MQHSEDQVLFGFNHFHSAALPAEFSPRLHKLEARTKVKAASLAESSECLMANREYKKGWFPNRNHPFSIDKNDIVFG